MKNDQLYEMQQKMLTLPRKQRKKMAAQVEALDEEIQMLRRRLQERDDSVLE